MILLWIMLVRLGIIVTVAFVLTRLRFFRQLINKQKLSPVHQLSAMVFFGLFGIIGTYTGITFNTDTNDFNIWIDNNMDDNQAIANSRVIGIVIAGLLGGYKIGIGAGLIAGIHRYTLGGFSAFACSLSAVIAGIFSAFIHHRFKNHSLKLSTAFFTGALAEAVQMGIILLTAKPFHQSFILVENIGIPMIISNGIGSLLFVLVIQNVHSEEEKAGAIQTQKALKLAQLTLSHLREGLTPKSAQAVCEIISHEVVASAVSMTDENHILAHVGLADDHHKPHVAIQTNITKSVLQNGELTIAGKEDIQCSHYDCPLNAVIIAPLKRQNKTIGTLKFYFKTRRGISHLNIQLIKGLSALLSNQLEIAEAKRAYQAAKELEIKALQAQIHPHFLFNSLSTIISLTRIEPAKARNLLVALSRFFRQNLEGTTKSLTTLQQEIKHSQAYLEIEQTRFVDRLSVNYFIDETVLGAMIPPLTLQPIVENAIKYGIKEKDRDCVIDITVRQSEEDITIAIRDNGVGISVTRLKEILHRLKTPSEGNSVGLYNVNRRLEMMFGEQAHLHIESQAGNGTTVSFSIPQEGRKVR